MCVTSGNIDSGAPDGLDELSRCSAVRSRTASPTCGVDTNLDRRTDRRTGKATELLADNRSANSESDMSRGPRQSDHSAANESGKGILLMATNWGPIILICM
jgi:hypothetical protein